MSQDGLILVCVIFAKIGRLFLPDLTKSAPCVDIDPLADLLNWGGSLWHSLFAEEPCDGGNSARLGFAHHRTLEVFAHSIDLCGGRALRGVAVDLNKVYARHREFLHPRVHLA